MRTLADASVSNSYRNWVPGAIGILLERSGKVRVVCAICPFTPWRKLSGCAWVSEWCMVYVLVLETVSPPPHLRTALCHNLWVLCGADHPPNFTVWE